VKCENTSIEQEHWIHSQMQSTSHPA